MTKKKKKSLFIHQLNLFPRTYDTNAPNFKVIHINLDFDHTASVNAPAGSVTSVHYSILRYPHADTFIQKVIQVEGWQNRKGKNIIRCVFWRELSISFELSV